jgi:hypothetical protein
LKREGRYFRHRGREIRDLENKFINKNEISEGANVKLNTAGDFHFRWISKVSNAFQFAGSLCDMFGGIYALYKNSNKFFDDEEFPGEYPFIIKDTDRSGNSMEHFQLLLDQLEKDIKILESSAPPVKKLKVFEKMWIPDNIIHDMEIDDTVMAIIFSYLAKKKNELERKGQKGDEEPYMQIKLQIGQKKLSVYGYKWNESEDKDTPNRGKLAWMKISDGFGSVRFLNHLERIAMEQINMHWSKQVGSNPSELKVLTPIYESSPYAHNTRGVMNTYRKLSVITLDSRRMDLIPTRGPFKNSYTEAVIDKNQLITSDQSKFFTEQEHFYPDSPYLWSPDYRNMNAVADELLDYNIPIEFNDSIYKAGEDKDFTGARDSLFLRYNDAFNAGSSTFQNERFDIIIKMLQTKKVELKSGALYQVAQFPEPDLTAEDRSPYGLYIQIAAQILEPFKIKLH